MKVASLKVMLEADTSKLRGAFAKLKHSVFNVKSAIVGLAGAGGLIGMVNSQLQAADSMGKFRDRIGISVKALSQFQHAAELSGVPVATLRMGLQRMTRRVGEFAATGKGAGAAGFKALGLAAEDFRNMAPEEQFRLITERLSGVEDASIRAALAQKIFDSEGVALLQMMKQGTAGLKAMADESDRLGKTLDDKSADGASKALDAFTRLKATVSGLGQAFALELAPEIEMAVTWMTEKLPKALDWVRMAFKRVGTAIGASAAMMGALLSGEFANAASIGRMALTEGVGGNGTNERLATEQNTYLRDIRDAVQNDRPAVAQ